MQKILVVLITLLIAACGTSPMKYQASVIDINEAKDIVEDLTWSQHHHWRPDSFVITDKYIAWGFGFTSKSSGFAMELGNSGIAIGDSSSRARNTGDRSYYRSIQNVELSSWKRKFKHWYVVSIRNKNGSGKYVLRTRNLEDAKLFIDAMTTIVNFYKKESEY